MKEGEKQLSQCSKTWIDLQEMSNDLVKGAYWNYLYYNEEKMAKIEGFKFKRLLKINEYY